MYLIVRRISTRDADSGYYGIMSEVRCHWAHVHTVRESVLTVQVIERTKVPGCMVADRMATNPPTATWTITALGTFQSYQ